MSTRNSRNSVSRIAIATAGALIATCANGAVVAQDVAIDQERDSRLNVLIEEVTITARKREESSQSTPIALTAFSGDSLDARGILSISEISQITPNLNFQNNPVAGGSSSVATVYIRGIGQRDFIGTIDNGVGFYVDDVIVARTVGAVIDLVDIERIEVLRGPQGTLFGRNNIGGAIKIHTKKPADEFGAYIEGQYGTDNQFRVKGAVDIPVSDRLKTRFSALRNRQDGYVDRPTGGDLGDEDLIAFRGAILFEPTDNLTINIVADYTLEEENGPAFTLAETGNLRPGSFGGFYNNLTVGATCNFGPAGGLTSTNPICFNDQFVSDTQNLGTAPTFSDTETYSFSFNAKYDINDNLSLRSITGYRNLDAQFARDADASPNTIVHFFDDFRSEQFSQELQLSATLMDGRLEWISGLYYFDENGTNINELEFAIAEFRSGSDFGTESKAVFSQATFHVSDKLDLTVGARWTDEDKTFDPEQVVGFNRIGIPFPDGAGGCSILDQPSNAANGTPGLIVTIPGDNCPVQILPFGENQRQTQDFTPMVNLSYTLNDETLLYATYSEGFRSGGFVQRVFPPLPTVPDFGPEFVTSYEAGAKYTSEDGKLLANFAAYYTDYTDIQVRTERPDLVGELEDNIGDAEIWGFELETRAQLTNTLFFELAYGYTNASYTAIRVTPPLASTVTLDDSFDHVPEHNISGALTKEFYLNSGSSIIARVDANYTTEYANDPDNSPEIFTPDVFLMNASVRWLSEDEKYQFTFGVKNLTDEQYILSGYLNEAIGLAQLIRDRGRQWFVSTRINF